MASSEWKERIANREWRIGKKIGSVLLRFFYSLFAPSYSLLPIRHSPLRQSVAPTDHRVAIGRNDATRHQIFQMRQHGITGRTGQPRVDADIDRAHHGGNIRLAFGE